MIFENIEIRSLCNNDLCDFIEIFCTYFRNDLRIEISDKQAEELCSKIAESSISEIIPSKVLLLDGKMVGFVSYQIDTPHSDWCEREGWGFIREVYIHQALRGKGLGSKLVTYIEKILYANGVENIYLTSHESGDFWESCGYKKTGKISEINHAPIYEK